MPKKKVKLEEEQTIEQFVANWKREKWIPLVTKKRKNVSEFNQNYFDKEIDESKYKEMEKNSNSNDLL